MVSERNYAQFVNTWYRLNETGQTEERLGQFLMNNLVPTEHNPTVFYEEDDKVSSVVFFKTYVSYIE